MFVQITASVMLTHALVYVCMHLCASVWPLSRPGAQAIAGALPLAVRQVNDNETLLPGRRLVFEWADSSCDLGAGLRAWSQLRAVRGGIDAVIGIPKCFSGASLRNYVVLGVLFVPLQKMSVVQVQDVVWLANPWDMQPLRKTSCS